jgi:hypothetical protein
MTTKQCLVHALLLALILTAGCSSQPEPAAESPPPTETEAPALAEVPIAAEEPVTTPAEEPVPEPVAPPAVATEPVVMPTATTTGHPEGWAVVDIGGEVEVGATQAGLTRIGANKCKICHKVQYASWAESSHGKRTPPLDCEGCHGPGSAYKGKKVMEDPEAARAAGMVIPERGFCEQCHKGGWTDDLLTRTHDHKVEGP